MAVLTEACEHYLSRATPAAVRVLVVDDHPGVRAGLVELFSGEDDLAVVGECEDGCQVVEAAARLRPHVVLMDLSMPTMDGVTATQALRDAQPDARVVVLTSATLSALPAVAAAGACGFVSKDDGVATLLRCLRSVAVGCFCCPRCVHGTEPD